MRPDFDSFREIADSLLRNKSRSLLTGFGIFWGLFMLLFLMGGGQGLKEMLTSNFQGFATNTTVIYSSQTSKPCKGFKEGRYWRINSSDIKMVKTLVPELDIVTAVSSSWGQTAVYGANSTAANVKGVYAEYAKVEEPRIKYGRYLNETDCAQERKVCILGKRIYNALFPEGGDPCGRYVKIGAVYYQVIGVDFSSGNLSIQGSADRAVIIPMTVMNKIYKKGDAVDLLAMTGKNGMKMSSLEPRLRQIMARRHSFDPSDKSALGVINTEQLFQVMDNLFNGVNFLIWLVGLGTILAGAIGVSNIMMVTVKERTTEIGIRRAIGATPVQVLSQILMESVTLTLAAGTAGIVFSVTLLGLLEKLVAMKPDSTPVAFQIGFWTALAAVGMLAVVGMVAGFAPALRAMRIKPVDAMRDE